MSVLKIRNTSTGTWEPIESIKGDKGDQGFVSSDLKRAMLQLAQQIPSIDERGPRYYQDLWNALFGDDYIANFTPVGDPQIENGILTASSGNYIETPEAFDPGSVPWELTVKIKRPSIPSAYETFVNSNGVQLRTSWASANTTIGLFSDSGTIIDNNDRYSVPAGSWRWLKATFNGSNYNYGMSTDGVSYTWLSYIPSAMRTSTPIKAGKVKFGSSSVAQFDLRETEIKVNGQTWWKPYIFE